LRGINNKRDLSIRLRATQMTPTEPRQSIVESPGSHPVSPDTAQRILAFSAAPDLKSRQANLIRLIHSIQQKDNLNPNHTELANLVEYLETDEAAKTAFQLAFAQLLRELGSISLLAETGIPSDHALPTEFIVRLVAKFLPLARKESDASRLLITLYSSKERVQQFTDIPPDLFARMIAVCSPPGSIRGWSRQQSDLRDALRLLATRISWLGLKPEMRERSLAAGISSSPFYELLSCTENLLNSDPEEARANVLLWQSVVRRCQAELVVVNQHMETAGVSVELVFDLKKIGACFARMEALIAVLCPATPEEGTRATRDLFELLMAGRKSDQSLVALLRENLSLVARKTVERTGRSGEHYIAHNRSEYWQMWRAAIGGGLLTVFTAAIKMRIVEAQLPPFVEGFASGTNYAVSFVLLQIFGLVLATKQPAATAATFAGIVRDNRGLERSSKIAYLVSHITSTQLAAAIGNVAAVSVGAVLFEKLWVVMFAHSYLPLESATYVYTTLHPFASLTGLYAIITGIILWMAALAGGWCENFATYYRITEAVAQHPMGTRVPGAMRRVANIFEHNLGGWSTSVILGYLLGFTPVLGHFFGLPLDVRHVTLSSGTLALAAARFGTASLGRAWFYSAVEGIAVVFVLNLGVSFTIAGMVALRAYDVSLKEQLAILRFLCREAIKSPLRFILPPRRSAPIQTKADESTAT
jgi:site-specific recombinase